ncbi:hypothetical protein AMATHDRAFT_50363 [Amanita thiersii Skay4041]|uniref:Uncharacterized protein n=1 Tax=Amanita thiersii Skay4041 TaxID=703135 RepID=A0A2A9NI51_9AGAR|nr:hypothetical protein AMATHDRAFT_50363 [Amanita thiersii Skay4041]
MASPFMVLNFIAKTRAHTGAQKVNATGGKVQQDDHQTQRAVDKQLDSPKSTLPDTSNHPKKPIPAVEEPSYTVVQKPDVKPDADVDHEWTDIGFESGDKDKESRKVEPRKKDVGIARREEEQRKKEEFEDAARAREDKARQEERTIQEKIREQERGKLESSLKEWEEKAELLQERIAVLEKGQSLAAKQLQDALQQVDQLNSVNRMLKQQLKCQSDELQSLSNQTYEPPSQVTRFLTTGVARSRKPVEEEAAALIDLLNSENYQAAACIADLLESPHQASKEPSNSGDGNEARVIKVLGKRLTGVIKSRTTGKADLDPLAIQVALQMCFNYCCTRIIGAWCPGIWNYSDFLTTLFTRIRGSEDTATANKWRSVTRAQFKQNKSTQTEMTQFVIDHVVDLLTLMGWKETSKDGIMELLRERCSMITAAALQINNMINEDATGDQLEVAIVYAGELFDSEIMENAYDNEEGGGRAMQTVATTDLGLRRTAGTRKKDAFILKPKVILTNAFDAETRRMLERR